MIENEFRDYLLEIASLSKLFLVRYLSRTKDNFNVYIVRETVDDENFFTTIIVSEDNRVIKTYKKSDILAIIDDIEKSNSDFKYIFTDEFIITFDLQLCQLILHYLGD